MPNLQTPNEEKTARVFQGCAQSKNQVHLQAARPAARISHWTTRSPLLVENIASHPIMLVHFWLTRLCFGDPPIYQAFGQIPLNEPMHRTVNDPWSL